jgi:hypothetical protein
MGGLRVLVLRVLSLFHKQRLDENLDAELRAHLDASTEENIRRGMTPDEARYAARRAESSAGSNKQKKSTANSVACHFLRRCCGTCELGCVVSGSAPASRVWPS